jgi:uncharacterized membrane protein YeiH
MGSRLRQSHDGQGGGRIRDMLAREERPVKRKVYSTLSYLNCFR